jgi:hypothetical protein
MGCGQLLADARQNERATSATPWALAALSPTLACLRSRDRVVMKIKEWHQTEVVTTTTTEVQVLSVVQAVAWQ